MRCKTCQYALWDLTSRTCPECGTSFAPSEFEFVPNSVRFCCPHCAQPYYGTDHRGHLVPQAFACTSCQRPITMDQMRLLPAEGVDERATETTTIPWLEVDRQKSPKLLTALFRTVWMAMVAPHRLGEQLRPGSSCWRATAFAIATTTIYLFMAIGLMVAVTMVMAFTAGPAGIAAMLGSFTVAALAGVVLSVVFNALWALCSHGLLMLTGLRKAGLGTTYNAICYAAGANVVTAVPCLGGYVGWIWWLVSAVLITMKAQAVSGWRASLAVLAPPLAVLVAIIGLYAWLLTAAFTGAGVFAPGLGVPGGQAVQAPLLVELAAGNAVRHPAELLSSNAVGVEVFIHPDTPTMHADVPIGSGTLESYTPADIAQAVASVPGDATAVRMGDLVFCHYGIDIADPAHTGLWIVFEWPDPDAGGTMPSELRAYNAGGGASIARLNTRADADSVFARQNDARVAAGLAPLPPPEEITHAKPARSSDQP